MTVLRAGSASDVGRIREVNQDSVLASATVFAVADGMGGHAGGEVASSSAIAVIENSLATVGTKDGMVDALRRASSVIAEEARQNPTLAGMGTTMVLASLVGTDRGDDLVVANVGDSRAYLYRRGVLTQITSDHSIPGELMKEGSITEDEAAQHPQRHVITRFLGNGEDVDVDLFDISLLDGDRVVLCSDGLTDEVSNEEISRVLDSEPDPSDAAHELVRRANANGGVDNISVVVIEALVADSHDDEPTQAHQVVTAIPIVEEVVELAPTEPPVEEGWRARRKGMGVPRLLTFRVLFFIVLVGAVVYGAWYFVHWYATSSYYVTTNGNQIVIYQGRPGGILWFKPKLVEVTSTTTSQVLPIRLPSLASDVTEPSLGTAQEYVKNLAQEYTQANPSPSTTTTTQGLAPLNVYFHTSAAV